MSIVYLSYDDVLTIHEDQINRYGGQHGVRDHGLVLSAIRQPEMTFGSVDLYPSVSDKAAAYLFFLVSNHPFLDGNKRVGALAAFVFLRLNDHSLLCSEEQYERFVWSVARGEASKEECAEFFRRFTKPDAIE